jgi:hypothetical protein
MEDWQMKYKFLTVIVGLPLLAWLILTACEAPNQPTFTAENDPNPTGLSAATISAVNPDEAYLKDIITISGSGFNTTQELNLVAFGSKTAKIVTATATELKVQAPNISGETVPVKVAIKGSEFWSNEIDFMFKLAVETLSEEINWAMGVEADDDGNVYVGSAADEMIYKISPDGSQSEFASLPMKGAMGWGPDNHLYVCEMDEGKIVRISPDGSTIEDYAEAEGAVDFDWASNGNMYIVQNWEGGISMFDGSAVTHVSEYEGELKSCRVFGEYLYVTAIWDGVILKFPITVDGLGDAEVVFEGDSPVGLEFDSEGTMYYTLAWETSLYTMKDDGSEEVLYEGELMTPMRYITFHNKFMYIVFPGWEEVGAVMKAYIGVEQAPNYGLK